MVSKRFWNKDGSVQRDAPRWANLRAEMRTAFPTYYSTGTSDPFGDMVGQAISYLNRLKPPQSTEPGGNPGYVGNHPSGPHYGKVTEARLGENMASIADVLQDAADEAGAGGSTSDNLLSGIGRQSLKAWKRSKQRLRKKSNS